MTGEKSQTWLDDGEKYALIGLNVKLEGELPAGSVSPNLSVLVGGPLEVPPHWQTWLGSIRVQEIENCNLFLIGSLASKAPGILDAENQLLQRRVHRFYVGLMLASRFASAHKPVMLLGSKEGKEIGVRQEIALDPPVHCLFRGYPALLGNEIQFAAQLAENLETVSTTLAEAEAWRLYSVLHIYSVARAEGDILDRIHQYCRCIDGLILPQAGESRRQFRSRTELFIGPRHHDLMGEIYDVRSAVEHLHENRYLENFERGTRLDLVKKEAIVEHITRRALSRIVSDASVWPHFANTTSLAGFWRLDVPTRQEIWGAPFDPLEVIGDFDPDKLANHILGSP